MTDRDILLAAELALPHRMKKAPFQDSALEPRQLEERLRQIRAELGPTEEQRDTGETPVPTPSVKKKMS